MGHRFAAASAVGALVIGLAALFLTLFSRDLSQTWLLTAIWCFVPLAWGIWAMLTPQAWMPERLPSWGAILGLIAGTIGFLVLNVPYRAFAWTLSVPSRATGAVVAAVVYYFLWMLVRSTYAGLAGATRKPEGPAAAGSFKKAA